MGTIGLSDSLRNVFRTQSLRANAAGRFVPAVQRYSVHIFCSGSLYTGLMRRPDKLVPVLQIEYGGECHISGRPYTVFRWRPGNDARSVNFLTRDVVEKGVSIQKQLCGTNVQVQKNDHMSGGGQGQECLPGLSQAIVCLLAACCLLLAKAK